MRSAVFWLMLKRTIARGYQRFRGPFHLHIQGTGVRSEVVTAVRMTMLLFWVVTPCRFESTRRHNPEEQHRQGTSESVRNVGRV
jgi:hypothetical protein